MSEITYDLSCINNNAIKECMKNNKNILLEEMSANTTKKYLSKDIKKLGYELITFQFVVNNINTSHKRDLQRVKNKEDKNQRKVLGKKFIAENHEYHKKKIENDAIIINTSKLGKRQVADTILKNLGLK